MASDHQSTATLSRCEGMLHNRFSRGGRTFLCGFTLIELLIALAIAGILAAIAYPTYVSQIRRGKRSDAEAVMLEAAQYLQRYYVAHNSYEGADLSVPGLNVSPKGAASGSQEYDISVTVPRDNAQSYAITATLATGKTDAACGNLTLTDTGRKASSVSEAGMECWR